MKYFLLISNSDGEARLVPISDVMEVSVEPGDDIVVMDESGNAVDVSLRPEDDDLIVEFQDGSKAVLKDFYNQEEDSEPITISLNPVEPVADDYEFNSQTGNLPNGKSFTLMRFSNTEYVQLVEQLDELKGGVVEGALTDFYSGIGSGGSSACCDDEDLILDPVPIAAPDLGSGIDGNLINIDLLTNDTDARGDGLEIHSVGGIGVISGSSITLPSGSQVTVNGDGTIDFLPGSSFDSLQAGESGTETFIYSIRDGGGNIATSEVTVTVEGINDPPVANPDEFELTEDAPVTVDLLVNDSDPDTSDTLTVVGISTPPGGSAVVNGDNTVTFDPSGDFEYLGAGESTTVELTYTISDDSGATATSTVTFTISGQNDAPDAIDDAGVTDQNTAVVIDALLNDTDPDANDQLAIVGVTQPAKGQVIYNNNGDVTFDPDGEFDDLDTGESETVTFTYDISDGNGGTDTATITVTVTGTDDATVTAPDAAVTDENSSVLIDVLANDTDPDTTDLPLTVTGVTQPPAGQGSVAISGGGANVTFNPGTDFDDLAAGESETVTFTYDATTSDGDSVTETVTVTVNGLNDAPDAIDDADVTDQNSAITIDAIANDTDVDGSDVLLITGVDQPGKGIATVDSSNQIAFDPNGEFDDLDVGESETVTFDYNISDGNGGTDTATITVTVTGTDDATVTAPDAAVTDENSSVLIDVLANDTDPDTTDLPLTVTGVTQPPAGQGSVAISGGGANVTFNPGTDFDDLAAGESETVTFTYDATTSDGDSVTETVTVTVNGLNDAPDAIDDVRSTDQDTAITIDALSNDTDPDTSDDLSITGVTQPAKGSVTWNSGDLTFDPGSDFRDLDTGESETVTFTYDISDGEGGTDTATITVTVTGLEDPTTTAPDEARTDEETAIAIDVLANDSDPDGNDNPLSVASVNPPAAGEGTVINAGSSIVFIPGPNFQALADGESGTSTFTYVTNTGSTETVTVTVDGLNDNPDAVDDARATDQDTVITVDVLTNDTDADSSDVLQVTGVDQPAKGTVSIDSNNQIVFDPGNDFQNLDDGESETVSFDYQITDENGGTDTATVTITVAGTDDAIETQPDAEETDENTAVVVDVLANDTDPDSTDLPLTVTGVTQPPVGQGSVAITNGGADVTFSPGADFEDLAVGESEIVTFTYDATNADGDGVSETVTITVNGLNDAPDAIDDARTTDQDTTITIDAVANDTDPDTSDDLTIIGVDQPGKGTATIDSNNQIAFDPNGEFDDLDVGESETVTFDYNISDGNGGTDTATITVTVTGTDDATVTAPDAAVTDENSSVLIDVLANDTDPDTTDLPLTVTGVTQPPAGQGSVAISGGGANVTFNPGTDFDDLAAGESETVTFTYDATTSDGDSVTETVTVTVNGLNDAPDAIDDARTTDQNSAITIDAIANDTDVDGSDVLLITGVDQPTKGSAYIDGNNQVVFNPEDDFGSLDDGESETVTFDYQISDGNGGTDTATITVTVTGTDEAIETQPDAEVTDENTPVIVDVLANDTDPDSTDLPLTVTGVSQPPVGQGSTVVSNGGADVTFTPGADFDDLAVGESETVTFTYDATNADGDSVSETVTITVNGLNDAPDAIDDARTTDQDTTITIDAVANDTDPDTSDDLTIIGVDQPGKGSATIDSSNQVVFDPSDEFDDLDAGESETVTFDYTISDGNGGTDTATITVTVTGTEDATVTAPDTDVTDENTPVVVDVLANDTDPDSNDIPLTVTGITQPPMGQGSVAITNGGADVTFDPGTDFDDLAVGESEIVTFTYDTDTGATETVTITVEGTNDAPDAIDDARTTDQDTPLTIDALSNDTDVDGSDVLSITGVTQPTKGTVTYNAGDLSFDPGDEFDDLDTGESETVTFTYDISDGEGGTDTATITVTVTGTEDPTVTAPDNEVTDENTPVVIDVLANDTDPDSSDIPLTVTGITQPPVGQGSVAITNGGADVTFTPGADFDDLAVGESETVTFTYTTDTGATETVTVTVNGLNDAPDAIDDVRTTDQNSAITIDAIANDTDVDGSDVLLITGVDQPSKGSAYIDGNNQVVFNPEDDFGSLDDGESETVTFDYQISDGNGGTDTATITVTVTGTDEAIETQPDAEMTDENTAVVVDVLANDTDPDSTDLPLTVTGVSQPPVGQGSTVVSNGGADVTFTPGADFDDLAVGESETVTFTYDATNADGDSVSETVTITVNGLNDAPDAIDDARTTDQDTTITIDAVANDTDPDTSDDLTIIGVDQPGKGTATIDSNNQVVFDPSDEFDDLDVGESETVTFDYTISDGNGGTDTATITVTVTGVEDATVTAPDTEVTDENTPVVIDVLANDTDSDSNDIPLTVTGITQPPVGQGSVAITNGGADVTFDPGTDFDDLAVGESEIVTFTYDTDTGATETVTITVEGTNDAPDAIDDARTANQDTTITIDAVANDTDPDTSDDLTIIGVDQPTKGTATIDSNNQIAFDPNGEFDDLDVGESETVTFDYNISDGNGGTDTATITVTVTGTDDATVTAPDAAVTDENSSVLIDVLANDTDPDTTDLPLTVTGVTQPPAGQGSVAISGGGANVTFNPGTDFDDLAAGESETVTFTYDATTSDGDSVTETVTVTVNGLNDAPDAIDDVRSTDQDTAITIDALSNDTDPDTSDDLSITGVTQPAKGSVTWNSGDLTFDPGSDFRDLDTGESETVTFTYDISDGEGGTDTATITVTVTGLEDPTTTAPDEARTDEETAIAIDVLANDSDPDGNDNPLSVASVNPPAAGEGTVINAGSSIVFIPGPNFQALADGESGTSTFTYVTNTGSTETVTVTVDGLNDNPDAVDDARATDQDTVITVDVLTNDTDADSSDVLQVTGVDQPAKGTVSIDSNNQIVFDPGNDFQNLDDGESETVTFDYQITDENGGTDTATVTITVAGTDDAIETQPDAEETDENTAVVVDVLANDTDPDSTDLPLTVTGVTQPPVGQGSVAITNGGADVTFSPGADFEDLAVGESEIVTFTYDATNADGDGVSETVTITVNGLNDAPDAIDDARTTDQDTPLTIDALSNDTDVDGSDVLSITGVTQPTKGTVTYNAGDLSFDPGDEFDDLDTGESETVTFTYDISDGEGGTDTATITVTVTGTEDPTVTAPDNEVTDENTPVVIDVLANDTDPDSSDIPLTVTGITQPPVGQGSVAITNGGADVTFTPGADFDDLAVGESETVTFTYTTDTGATETVTITVNGLNDAPNAIDDVRTTDQNSAITIDAVANDTDADGSDVLLVTGVDQPTKGSAYIDGNNQVVLNPEDDFGNLDDGESETVTFDYQISDGNGGTDTATITVTVTGTDEAIETAPDSGVTNENTPVIVDVLANDTDPDSTDLPLTVTGITQPPVGQGSVAITNGGADVTFSPGADFNDLAVGESEIVTFTYDATNADGDSVSETVTITVNGLNDAPDAIDDARTTDQDTTITIDAVANDTDPDTSDDLTIIGVDQPGKGSATIDSSNQVVFDPSDEFDDLDVGESETVTFDYTISDGNGGTDTATITVTVMGVEDATVTAPDTEVTDENTPVVIDVLANDTDPDSNDIPLTVTGITQPPMGQGSVAITNGGADVTFDPGTDFDDLAVGESEIVTFTYDTDTGATETVTITVEGTNDAPDAIDDARTTDQDTTITIDAVANDTDPDTSDNLTIIGVDQPGKGTATIDSNNQIDFDPNGEFDDLDVGESETVTFDYNISDGNGGTDTATITVTVTGTDDATVTAPDAAVTDENSSVLIDVLANDTDPDTTDLPLTVTGVTQPPAGQGSVAISGGGANVTFNPGMDFDDLAVGESETVTFTYDATTSDGDSVTETVTITVNGLNDAPNAIDDVRTTDQNSAITIDAIANDTDVDGSDVLLITGVDQPTKGSAYIDGNNQVVFNPEDDFGSLDDGESETVTFDYQISDGNGGTDTATITVTVTGTDEAIETAPDSGVTNENTSVVVDVLANDTDPDSTDLPLTVTGVSQPPVGQGSTVVSNGGADVTFTPGADFDDLAVGESETVTFTYDATNADGDSVSETVTITVNGLNDAPDAIDDARTTDQDTTITIDAVANDTDPDTSDDLTIIGVDQPGKGTATIDSNNQIDFDPNGEFDDLDVGESETVTFDYNISDGNGGTDTATITVTVTGTDDATVTAPDAAVTDENSSVLIDVLANDTDPDTTDLPLTVTGVTQPPAGQGSVAISGGGANVTFNPGTDFDDLAAGESETVTFTYDATTSDGDSVTETVTVTVNGLNDAPDAIDDARTTDQNSAITIDAIANDTDVDGSDVLLITGVDQPSKGSAVLDSNNEILFDPGTDFDDLDAGESETVTFDYSITDGNGGTDTATITVTVTGTDEALDAAPDFATTDEDSIVAVSVLSNDTDPDTTDNPLAIDSFVQPAPGNGSVAQVGSDLVFDPGADFQDLAVGETDVVTFDYTVINQDGATAVETVTITVTGANDDPTAVDDSESVTQNGSTNIDLLGADDSVAADSDPDGDSLSITTVDGKTAGGTVTLTSGALLSINANGTADYTPNGAFDYLDDGESAVDTFDYSISDGNGGTDTATVTVTVTGADDAMTTVDDVASTTENSPVTIDVLSNDDDPDTTDKPLAVQSVSQPAMGSVANNGTDVTFDPGTDFDYLAIGESATVTFSYTAVNQDGATAVETVTVTVIGQNDGPETHEDTLHTIEGVGRSVDVIQNDADSDSPQLTITEIDGVAVTANQPVTLGTGAIVTVLEDGRVYFNPNGVYSPLGFGETAVETLNYTVTDSEGATATEDVTVIIDGVDNEVVFSGAYQVLSNQLYEIQLDPVDESIVYVPIGDPLPFNFNSIGFNSNDGYIYANATQDDAGSGTTNRDIIQIDPFSGQVVANLGQVVNDEGEPIPNFAGAINSDLGTNGIWYVNGDPDSSGNRTYAIDLNTMNVTGIGNLPGADYGVDVTTGLIWSVQGNNSYSLDPTSGVLTTFTHGGLQDDGMTAADGSFGSMFADGDGNIQVTSNSGFGLYRLNTSDGSLTRVTDAPATTSNDATGTFVSTLPSASPFLFLDADESTQPATNQDVIRNYDPSGGPVSIADTDAAIADLDGNTISSARIVLTNVLENDLLTINGPLPGGITGSVAMEGGFLVANLTGDASQQDYADAIEAVTFSNTSTGSVPTDVRAIDVTVTDIDGVLSNTATSLIFVGAGTGVISGRDVQSQDDAYADSLVVMEDDNDPTTGGARLDLLENDSDDPTTITGVTQPPSGEGSVINNGDGTATFNPGDDFHYLSEGETAITSFTYSTNTGETETVTVTVHGVDDPLEATPDSGFTDANSPITIDVLANDEDPDTADNPLTLSAVTQPAGGSVSIVGNNAVFDPGNDFDGLALGQTATVTFIYTVTNADGVDENELVTVTVTGTNEAPNAVDDSASTGENSQTTISVLGNDSDPESDTLTVTGVSQPNNGSVTHSTGDVTFDPGSDFDGLAAGETAIETFTYEISDGNGGTDTATVTVTVNGENNVPDANADLINTDRNEPVTFAPLENDPDIDGDTLTVTRINGASVNSGDTVTLSSGALVTLNAGGTFTYDANGNYDSIRSGNLLGEDSFTYQVSDGNGGFATATASVVLTPQLLLANGALGYATPDSTAELYTFIPDTSTVPTAETTALSQIFDGEGMTMRPSTGMVIVFDDTTAGDLYQIDPNTGTTTFIGATGILDVQGASFFVDSMTFEETLYVIGNGGGDGGDEIFKVDPDTGTIDPNGFGPGVDRIFLSGDISALSSLTIDPATGLGWGTDDNSSLSTYDGETGNPDLYTVDLTTGNTTFVAGLPNGIDGESLAFAVDGKLYTEDEGTPKTIYEVNKTTGALTPASEWVGTGDVEGMAFNAFFNLFSPAVDLDSTAAGNDYTATFSGNPESVASFDSDLDSERTNEVIMATITLTNPQSGDELNIGSLPSTIIGGQTTDDSGQLVVTLYVTNGNTGTIGDFETAIEEITFENNLSSPNTTDRIIEVRIMDTDGTLSEPAISTIEIAITPPIVIDMDRDGVEFDGIEEGIAMDVDGDGELEQTAWAGEDDAVLIYDGNDNNDVDGLEEFAFARYSDDPNATDLDGLRYFDSNEDLILDANDAEFEAFKLWQDKDGDGIVDEGEMQTLSEAGIESLELNSDGLSYEAADGDVFVHGEAGVNYADGSKGTLADSEFKYEELADEGLADEDLDSGLDDLEILTDQGEVLDVNDSETEPGEATPDILEPAPPEAGDASSEPGVEGGAVSGTSVEDDMAAADAAMS